MRLVLKALGVVAFLALLVAIGWQFVQSDSLNRQVQQARA